VREALLRDLEAARVPLTGHSANMMRPLPQTALWPAELEARWNRTLLRIGEVKAKIAEHDAARTSGLERSPPSLAVLADDLSAVWSTPATDARLKKRIVRTAIQEVIADIDTDAVLASNSVSLGSGSASSW
jgi:hypothetical protein